MNSGLSSPIRTEPHFFGDYFRIGGHSPGTRTVGVFLFGLVNERIGDLHSLRIGKGSIGRNHVSEMPDAATC